MWNIEGRGVVRKALWEILVCWLEPNFLILVTRSFTGWPEPSYLSHCCPGQSTSIQYVPAKKHVQMLPVLAARPACVCRPRSLLADAFSVHPERPSSGPSPDATPPQAFPSDGGMGDLSLSTHPTALNLVDLRSFQM